MQINIETLEDEHVCELCGCDFATGYKVIIDGKQFKEYTPLAHCFDNKSYELSEVLLDVLKSLGHSINLKRTYVEGIGMVDGEYLGK